MNLTKRILGILIALSIMLLCAYLSFPWWGKSLIESKLPPDWRLDAISIQYPGWQIFSFESMSLSSDEWRISVENFSLNLANETVMIDAITVTQIVKKQDNQTRSLAIALPQFHPDFFLATLPFKSLSVEHIIWQTLAATYRGDQLKFNLASSRQAQLALQLLPNAIFASRQHMLIDLEFSDNQLSANLSLNAHEALQADWQIKQDSHQLRVSAEIAAIKRAFPALINLSDVDIDGSVTLRFTQQIQNQHTRIDSQLAGFIRSEHFATTPIQFLIASQSDELQLPVKVNSNAQFWLENKTLSFHDTNFIAPRLNIDSSLRLSQQGLILDSFAGQLSFEAAQIQRQASQYRIGPAVVDLAMPVTEGEIFSAEKSLLELIFSAVPVVLIDSQAESADALNAKLHGHLQLRNMRAPAIDGALVAEQIQLGKLYQSSNSPVSLEVKNLQGDLSSGEIHARLLDHNAFIAGINFDQLEANLSATLINGKINGSGTIDLNQEPLTGFQILAELGSGSATLSFPLTSFSQLAVNHLIASSTRELDLPVELTAGNMTHQATISLSPVLSLDNQLDLKGANLAVGDNQLTAVKAKLSSALNDGLVHQLNFTAEKLTAKSGNTISDIRATARYQAPDTLNINALSFHVFDGVFNSDAIEVIDGDLMTTSFEINDVSLQAFFDALQIQELTVKGRGNIVGKIRTEQGSLVVEKFEIRNISPGVLKYTDFESLGLSDNLATQALENFHYTELEGEAVNATKHAIPLKIRILGTNPELKIDRPFEITFNLNATIEGAELLEVLLDTIL